MDAASHKFNDNIQLFSQEQLSRIFKELKLKPGAVPDKPLRQAPVPGAPAAPSAQQSVADILKSNFIAEEPE
ncbi:MAG: hypothetical protein LBD99_06080 [Candidatus Margulisbacteria bacterium]|jgi:hypothetical protein|nr:hypothetical protein [Candidatus Margulisiibacteriota bacterium]